MPIFERISTDQARQILDSEDCHLIDIRDPQSYQCSRVPGAKHVGGDSVEEFLNEADRHKPLLVYCYHGNSSQSAAQFFVEQRFNRVYSVDGGFEAWRQSFEVEG